MNAIRTPWPDAFPDVVIAAGESTVKQHADYAAAKSGDTDAAIRLVHALLEPGAVDRLAALCPHGQPLLVSAHAEEEMGRNAIPQALAAALGQKLGWPVDAAIVQANIVNHTGASGFARLARQALFVGELAPDRDVVLVDDFVGQGGTLANLRGHVGQQGCRVLAAFALTGKPHSATLRLTPQRLHSLRHKHGNLEDWWRQRFGYGYDCLTASEARYLENTADADTIRDRIAAAEQAADPGPGADPRLTPDRGSAA